MMLCIGGLISFFDILFIILSGQPVALAMGFSAELYDNA